MNITVKYEKKKPFITAEGRINVDSLLSEQVKLPYSVVEWTLLDYYFRSRDEKTRDYIKEVLGNNSFLNIDSKKPFVDAVIKMINSTQWDTPTKKVSLQKRPPWNLMDKLILSTVKVFSALFYEVVKCHVVFKDIPRSCLLTDPLDVTACTMHLLFHDLATGCHKIKEPFWTKDGVSLNDNFNKTYVREGRKILRSGEGLIEALLIGRWMFRYDATKEISLPEKLIFLRSLFLDVFSPVLACLFSCPCMYK